MSRLIAFLLLATSVFADSYLFTSFRKNGETGVYLAVSQDGRKWIPLNGNHPWIKPGQPGMLMRDPFLTRGPDGTWHLLWTWGWTRKETGGALKIGYSSSRNLVEWTPQKEIRIFENEPTARNAWAPEAAWDEKRREWIVFWSSTIPGRFPDGDASENGYNHRIYAMRTKDWVTFSEPQLWLDPGFNCIDGTVVRDGKRWVLIFKDERKNPEKKILKLAFAESPAGPWKGVTEGFTPSWVEGPTALKIGGEWWIYFDHYTQPRHYGAVKTKDWKSFENVTESLSFPEDHRHGTIVRITDADAARLTALSR